MVPGLSYGAQHPWRGELLLPAIALGMANAAVRPLMLAVTLPMGILGFGMITAALNGFLLYLFSSVGMLAIRDVGTLVFCAGALAIINTAFTTMLSIDDEDRFYRKVLRHLVSSSPDACSSLPGLLIMEIDGLAFEHLQRARARRRLPHIDRLVREGNHLLAEWDCGVPSQTSSSQAGIMFGNSYDIPAFRWYDRKRDRLIVSGNPKDAWEIEKTVFRGHGLLKGGSSVNNLLSGEADQIAITLSEIGRRGVEAGSRSGEILQFFFNPYCFSRALILLSWEMIIQGMQELWAFVRRRRPHGPLYPLNRALSTVLLRDLGTYLVVRDLMRGSPAIYVSFIGYDVVSHLSGPTSGAAFGVLSAIDRQVGRLMDVARIHAPRPYRIVILSDHGQSPGKSFRDRYGSTMSSLVKGLVSGKSVGEISGVYPSYLQALLKEVEESEEMPTLGRARKRALRHGRLYIARQLERKAPAVRPEIHADRVVVCCSGNLAHIYLPGEDEFFFVEQIDELYPGLIAGLLGHPGIGFLLVRSASRGLLVLGSQGLRELDGGIVEGIDPLTVLRRPEAATKQLLRLGRFPNTGDIVANSMVAGDQVASFEDQTGSHGGMGGPQNYPFVVLPRVGALAMSAIDSPEQLHTILCSLREQQSFGARAS